MKKLYIIKVGTTFSSTLEALGDFDDWIITALARPKLPLTVVDVVSGSPLPASEECYGVIVTGSHAMVTDNLPWSLRIESWIPSLVAAEVPFLGICYGHQLLGRAMGGEVGYNSYGKEIGTVAITLTPESNNDLLFNGIPATIQAHTTHAQSVLKLPSDAFLLSSNAHEQHHAFRIGTCAWGVQFHPEYSTAVMQAYINAQAESLKKKGRNVEDLLLGVTETPFARKVLSNFASLVYFPLA
ncbi:MAG: glutamine amidotransferase [Chlorobiales bacterium]|nr:glutamine amidotransferase [Chlorobiales bacterium]